MFTVNDIISLYHWLENSWYENFMYFIYRVCIVCQKSSPLTSSFSFLSLFETVLVLLPDGFVIYPPFPFLLKFIQSVIFILQVIFISAKEIMFSVAFVCLFVC